MVGSSGGRESRWLMSGRFTAFSGNVFHNHSCDMLLSYGGCYQHFPTLRNLAVAFCRHRWHHGSWYPWILWWSARPCVVWLLPWISISSCRGWILLTMMLHHSCPVVEFTKTLCWFGGSKLLLTLWVQCLVEMLALVYLHVLDDT